MPRKGDRERNGFQHCHVSPLIHFLYSIQFIDFSWSISFLYKFCQKRRKEEEEELDLGGKRVRFNQFGSPRGGSLPKSTPDGGTMQPQTDTLTRLLRCLFVRPLARSIAGLAVCGGIAGIDYGRRRQERPHASEQGRRLPQGIFDPKSG